MRKIKLILIWFFLYLAGCSYGDEKVQSMNPAVFKEQGKCVAETRSLIKEWKSNGGGYKRSLQAMRKQIQEDKTPKFSVMIRKFWAYQNSLGNLKSKEQLGVWPVSDDDFRSVFFETVDVSDFISVSCGLSWLSDALHDDVLMVYNSDQSPIIKAPLEEFPDDLKWESNQAQLWLKYWLFVNVSN